MTSHGKEFQDQSVSTEEKGSYCELVNKGDDSVDAAVWSVLSQLDDISSLKEEPSTALKAFGYS